MPGQIIFRNFLRKILPFPWDPLGDKSSLKKAEWESSQTDTSRILKILKLAPLWNVNSSKRLLIA